MWRGAVSFGLVNIPVKLYKAADEASSVSLCNIHRGMVEYHSQCHSRITGVDLLIRGSGELAFCPTCKVVVPDTDIELNICGTAVKEPKWCPTCQKMLETGDLMKAFPEDRKKEHCIPITEEEMAALPLASAHTIQVDGFVKTISDIRYYDTVYVLEPEDAGMRAFALFEKAMADTGAIGVAKITTGSKEHLCAIRPTGDGLLYVQTLHWTSDLRSTEELKRPKMQVTEKELTMAKMLIDTLPTDIDLAKYTNQYGEALRKLVELKKQGITITTPAAPPPKEVDLVEQLMASLKAAKVG
jgi:DNA end-binding protein Ku